MNLNLSHSVSADQGVLAASGIAAERSQIARGAYNRLSEGAGAGDQNMTDYDLPHLGSPRSEAIDQYKKRLPGSEMFHPPDPADKYWDLIPKSRLMYPESPAEEYLREISGESECTTCANRRYMDVSDDSSVTYQSPTKIDPLSSRFAVANHEKEHVISEIMNAKINNLQMRKVMVTIKSACCPECGIIYSSGGITRTVTAKEAEESYHSVKTAKNKDADVDITR